MASRARMHAQFLVDADGSTTAVVLPLDDFRALVERLEELEDLQLIEQRKSESCIDIASVEELLARLETDLETRRS